MFEFGSRSLENLNTCHTDLQRVLNLALSRSLVDFGISEGHRPLERQKKLYAQGRTESGSIITNIDGVTNKGKHNFKPSEAADIYIYSPDPEFKSKVAFHAEHLCYVMGVIWSCGSELLEKGLITHKLRWGGNWDSDGVILLDQGFDDLPHIEIIK